VTIREDVIEEIARISGYDLLPETLPTGQTAVVARDRVYRVQEQVRATLVGSGLYEAITYVTIGETDIAPFVDDEGSVSLATTVPSGGMLRVINPLQAEKPFLRPTLIPSLLAVVRENLKHAAGVRFFEMARGYVPAGADELPHEANLLGIVMAGTRHELSRFGDAGEIDIFDLKGALEETLERLGVTNWSLEQEPHVALHPGRSAAVRLGRERIGWIGELRPDVAGNLGFDVARVGIAEIDLDAVIAAIPEKASDRTVPRFLPVEQDFAIVVEENTPAGSVEEVLRGAAGPLASGFRLFDIYQGPQIGEGKKSLAYRITFTAPDRALTDNDLGKVRTRIEKSLKQRVNGTLRG
jgi:phenylalanyl-tRNA synthetase beta chain